MAVIAAMARGIWTRRIHVVHGGPFAHPNYIVKEAEEVIAQFWNSRDKMEDGQPNKPTPTRTKWINPPCGRMKANWDVSVNLDSKRIRVGVIIWDSNGLVTLSRTMEACPVRIIAEAMGALQAT